jgi:UDPglucose 6-dehydrogenase
VNDARKKAMSRKIIAALGGSVQGKAIGVLGLTFKPNTDDMRDAPSLEIIPALIAAGAKVMAYDPEDHEARKMLTGVEFKTGPYDVAEGADAVVILTEWDQFRALDLDRLRLLMTSATLIDLRNVYRPEDMQKRGFTYQSIGRR